MRIGGSTLAGVLALMLLASSAEGSLHAHRSTAGPGTKVRIVFTGKGGGRYLDITRWLEDSTRECYARNTADEQLSVSWTLTWDATLGRRHGRLVLGPHSLASAEVNASVVGNSVRDFCDDPDGAADVGPDWPGTSTCDGQLQASSQGALAFRRVGRRTAFFLQGPHFGSPPKPCELDVRNDQLAAGIAADPSVLRRLATRSATETFAVGTRHNGLGVTYTPTRICSHFPHVYDGIVYLYDCEDTLTWSGTVTLTRLSG